MAARRTRASATVLLGALVLASCSDDGPEPLEAAACEALLTEAPVLGGFGEPVSFAALLHRLFSGRSLAGEPATVRVFVAPGQADTLEEVALEVGALDGTEVVDVVDLDEAFEEYQDLFEGEQPEMVEHVERGDLLTSVHVRVADEEALEHLHDVLDDDPRIHRVVDDRVDPNVGLGPVVFAAFGDQLDALRDAQPEWASVVEAIERPPDAPPLGDDELRRLRGDVDELLAAAVDDCGLELPE